MNAEGRDLIGIDRLKLDEEWAEQPRSHHALCLDAADAKLKEAEAKAEVELVEAEVDHDVRLHPGKYGLDDGGKLTEKVIAMAVAHSKRYRLAYRDYLLAKHGRDVAEAAVSASEHKKKGLEMEVQLHLSGYFAAPRARGDVKDDLDERKRRRQYERFREDKK
jgi:hypothetical protein